MRSSATANRQNPSEEHPQTRRLGYGDIRAGTRAAPGRFAEVHLPDLVIAGVDHSVAVSVGGEAVAR